MTVVFCESDCSELGMIIGQPSTTVMRASLRSIGVDNGRNREELCSLEVCLEVVEATGLESERRSLGVNGSLFAVAN